MRVLLDTGVLSELYKPAHLPAVHEAVEAIPDKNLYLSVITLGEIGKGIALLPESRRKRNLSVWLTQIENAYTERVLPIDAETTAIWGDITAAAQNQGIIIAAADALIAATALHHGLHLMTRNVKDFQATRAMLLNPWDNTS